MELVLTDPELGDPTEYRFACYVDLSWSISRRITSGELNGKWQRKVYRRVGVTLQKEPGPIVTQQMVLAFKTLAPAFAQTNRIQAIPILF